MNFGIDAALGAVAIGIGVYLWDRVSSYFDHKAFLKAKQESDQKQQEYSQQVDQLTKEIQDAKLTFDVNKRKLDSDSDTSK
jgi:hypothetical protein